MRKPEKTQAAIRRANRGNVPGVLGMEEMAMLMGRPPMTWPQAQKARDMSNPCQSCGSLGGCFAGCKGRQP